MNKVLAVYRYEVRPGRMADFAAKLREAAAPKFNSPVMPLGARLLRLLSGPQGRQGRPGERLARSLERLGPVSIKLGQVLSTRRDLLPEDYADELAKLQDNVPPFAAAQARALAVSEPPCCRGTASCLRRLVMP